MIKTIVKEEALLKHKTDCLIIHCLEEKKPEGVLKQIDARLNGAITAAFKGKRFEGKPNQVLLLNAHGLLGADHVLLTGLGLEKDLTGDKVCQASGVAARHAERARCNKISFCVSESGLDKAFCDVKVKSSDNPACLVAQGSYLALYHFDHYKSPDKENPPSRIEQIVFLASGATEAASTKKAVSYANHLTAAVYLARDLISHPGNVVTPTYLANSAKKMARKQGIVCKVLGKKEMERLGMGSLLCVAQGSKEPPVLISLEYKGGAKGEAPTVIVGKGVTFDTGGISLKPPAKMDEMKMDMSGAAVTLATLQAAASLRLPINLVGIIASVENMPSGTAIKPGDIVTSMSGKTIEVLNTDAEGRLILADALSYAGRYKPKNVIDLATLTGAVIVALGHEASAVLGNNDDLAKELIHSAEATGERLWQLPIWAEHEKATKSSIADLKNIASGNVGAGTIMGAAFLKAFVGDFPWCHIDIAGTSWDDSDKPYIPKGPSGYGVRLLINYLEGQSGEKKTKKRKRG